MSEPSAPIGATPGFGSALGVGRRSAVLVVDFTRGFTDPEGPLGSELDSQVAATRRLLDVARSRGAPVIFTVLAYTRARLEASLMVRKVPAMSELLVGTPPVEIDRRLAPRTDEHVVRKEFASAFSGTSLAAHLTAGGIDTLLVAGCSTSGCVRATAIDSAQHGIRGLIVRECVGDRWPLSHDVALAEIDSKYGDVIGLDDAIAALDAPRGTSA